MGSTSGAGIFGPYRHGKRWRVIGRKFTGGEAVYSSFATRDAAQRFIDDVRAEYTQTVRSVGEAIDAYQAHLIEKENGARSIEETPKKLRKFFDPNVDDALEVLTVPRCKRLYERLVSMKATKPAPGGKRIEGDQPLAVATQRQILLEARSFTRWCMSQHWLKENPLEEVQGKGKRRHGKPQLRIDDARIWIAKAMKLAKSGDVGAVAALMTLLMGNRASEITLRKVGDVDNDCTILWIDEAKTDASNGAMSIPDDLQPLLRHIVKGRKFTDYLFPAAPGADGLPRAHWRDWPRENVQRICRLAGVPLVTAHGMRGLLASLLFDQGAAGNMVAAAMRHTSDTVTRTSYAKKGAVRAGETRRGLKVLAGGQR